MRIRSAGVALMIAAGWMTLAPGQAAAQDKEPKKQRDVIARWEIEASPKRGDLIYDVIRSLRPHFLDQPRGVRHNDVGGGGIERPMVVVFIDGNQAGGGDVLKGMAAEGVEEVRYFDPAKAEAEYGLALGAGGVIAIKSYRRKPAEKSTSL